MRLCSLLALSLAMAVPAWSTESGQGLSKATEAVTKIKPALVKVQSSSDKKPQPKITAGVIVDPEGLAIAPYEEADQNAAFQIATASGGKLRAKVLRADGKLGLAILQVDGKRPLPCAVFADSDAVAIGAPVVAIGWTDGSPTPTTSALVVSAKKRPLANGASMLQVDSPTGPGIGPGVLVDLKGNVLGVLPRGGGVGLAVPSNQLKDLVSKLPK
jgi:S1-C subfamily serine protease